MPFNDALADRIRSSLKKNGIDFTEKKMFGGLVYMIGDKMCCGVLGDVLVARIGPEEYERALKRPHVSPMDFTGKPMKGYVYVATPATLKNADLWTWVQKAVSFVSTLKSSRKGSSRRKTISQIESSEEARGTPLAKLVNFGPVTLREFKTMGITTFGQIENLGWEETCRRWVQHFPERLNVNAFIGIIATLEGISSTKISASDRAKARILVNEFKAEYEIQSKAQGRTRSRL